MSRYGNIPLGRDDDEPRVPHRVLGGDDVQRRHGHRSDVLRGVRTAVALRLTAAGQPGTGQSRAAETAMATTMFHWTLHPWAIYAVVGLTIAYGVYRKGRLQLISAAFEPLLGKRANGPWGKVIDMLAIFATLFGSAASLGLGALQIRSGLHIVAGVGETGNAILIGIITILTVAFVLSAVSGVARGIQWLSNINMVLALAMALFIFLVGPTMFMLNMIPTSIGSYIGDLAADGGPHRRRRRGRQYLAAELDHLLLGVVDLLDPVRRDVHRPDLAWPHHPAIRDRACCWYPAWCR